MFGIFDEITNAVDNVIDVGIGVVTLGEYGDFNQRTVSKMVADGIEIAVVANFFEVSENIIKDMID